MWVAFFNIGHPWRNIANPPPNCVVIEAPLKEAAAIFHNRTGWDAAGTTSCCGIDFTVNVYSEFPEMVADPHLNYRGQKPLASYDPLIIRADEIEDGERVFAEAGDWNNFCETFEWSVQKYCPELIPTDI
jgi:hypothetical protein